MEDRDDLLSCDICDGAIDPETDDYTLWQYPEQWTDGIFCEECKQ